MIWAILILSLIVWIEIIVKLLNYKNVSSATTFFSYPFDKPLPSMFIGIIFRIVLIAAASVGIWYSVTQIFNILNI